MEILKDMQAGVSPADYKKTTVIEDREEAIKNACLQSERGDIILVAGKGHETYQEIKGVRHHFDDREVLAECLEELKDYGIRFVEEEISVTDSDFI